MHKGREFEKTREMIMPRAAFFVLNSPLSLLSSIIPILFHHVDAFVIFLIVLYALIIFYFFNFVHIKLHLL